MNNSLQEALSWLIYGFMAYFGLGVLVTVIATVITLIIIYRHGR